MLAYTEAKRPFSSSISLAKAYYALAKPGIIYGNLLSVAAGFLLASSGHIAVGTLLATLIGSSFGMACATVTNNYIDRNLDKKMKRTQNRALAAGTLPARNALIYAAILGTLGIAVLIRYTNWLVIVTGIIGYVDYIVFYSWAKRHSVHSTLVGSICGATPITAGYLAATGHLDAAAIIVFLILVAWQMPHFYAISIYRRKDYQEAGLPVLSVSKGIAAAKRQIMIYIPLFAIAATALFFTGHVGYTYLAIILALSVWWFVKGARSYRSTDEIQWGKSMFFGSLIVLLVTSLLLAIGPRLP